MLAPRALACSSVSMTISAPASPNTKPVRSRSNGRHAPAGSSFFVDITMRIWANAAIGTASILASTPPQMAMSASPSTMLRQACAMPSEPDAHADTGVNTPALACRSSPTAAAAPLGMYLWTAERVDGLDAHARACRHS